jgi:hypothetical protein
VSGGKRRGVEEKLEEAFTLDRGGRGDSRRWSSDGRLGHHAAAAVQCISGDGERRNEFVSARGCSWRSRLAPTALHRGKSCGGQRRAWRPAQHLGGGAAGSGGVQGTGRRWRARVRGREGVAFIGAGPQAFWRARPGPAGRRLAAAAASSLARWAPPGLATGLAGTGRSGSGLQVRPKPKG